LEVVTVSVKARVAAINNALVTIVEFVNPKYTIGPITVSVLDQNIVALRGKCIRYIKTIIERHRKDVVETILPSILGILPQTLTDSFQEVRSFARDILVWLEENFPDEVKLLIENANENDKLFLTKYDTPSKALEESRSKTRSPRTSLQGGNTTTTSTFNLQSSKRERTPRGDKLSPNRGDEKVQVKKEAIISWR